MQLTLLALQYGAVQEVNTIPAGFEDYYIPGSKAMALTAGFGSCYIQYIETGSVNILYCIFHICGEVTFLLSIPTPVIIAAIALEGNWQFDIAATGTHYLRQNHFNILSVSSLESRMHFKETRRYVLLGINYKHADILQALQCYPIHEYFGQAIQLAQAVLLCQAGIALNTRIIYFVNCLLQAPYARNIQNFHIQLCRKLLSLLLKQASTPGDGTLPVSIDLVAKLKQAKALIDEHIHTHFTIGQIARRTGMNTLQLKQLFRQAYNTSLYDYRKNRILLLAKEQLKLPHKRIKEVAVWAGYKQQSNFATAFRKKFGITPTGFKRKCLKE